MNRYEAIVPPTQGLEVARAARRKVVEKVKTASDQVRSARYDAAYIQPRTPTKEFFNYQPLEQQITILLDFDKAHVAENLRRTHRLASFIETKIAQAIQHKAIVFSGNSVDFNLTHQSDPAEVELLQAVAARLRTDVRQLADITPDKLKLVAAGLLRSKFMVENCFGSIANYREFFNAVITERQQFMLQATGSPNYAFGDTTLTLPVTEYERNFLNIHSRSFAGLATDNTFGRGTFLLLEPSPTQSIDYDFLRVVINHEKNHPEQTWNLNAPNEILTEALARYQSDVEFVVPNWQESNNAFRLDFDNKQYVEGARKIKLCIERLISQGIPTEQVWQSFITATRFSGGPEGECFADLFNQKFGPQAFDWVVHGHQDSPLYRDKWYYARSTISSETKTFSESMMYYMNTISEYFQQQPYFNPLCPYWWAEASTEENKSQLDLVANSRIDQISSLLHQHRKRDHLNRIVDSKLYYELSGFSHNYYNGHYNSSDIPNDYILKLYPDCQITPAVKNYVPLLPYHNFADMLELG